MMCQFFTATHGCLKEGLIVCTPDPDRHEPADEPPLQDSYIVTVEEILSCSVTARLIVLSSAHGSTQINHRHSSLTLASAFLAAGKIKLHSCFKTNYISDNVLTYIIKPSRIVPGLCCIMSDKSAYKQIEYT